MGADSSTAQSNAPSCTSRASIFQALQVSPTFSPFLARELVNISFVQPTTIKFMPSVPSVHSPGTIVNMIINCHDQIMNYPAIIEAIISAPTNRDESIIAILDTNFREYIKLFVFRDLIASSVKLFQSRIFTPFTFRPSAGCFLPPPVFSDLLDSFKNFYQLLLKNDQKTVVFDNVTRYFADCLPPSSLSPPLQDFCQRAQAHQEIFDAYQMKRLGICSNGAFLFILGNFRIYVFPITENGSLLPPIYREIDRNFTDSVSMAADDKKLVIHDAGFKGTILIHALISGEIGTTIALLAESEAAGYGFIVSDGITQVYVDPLWRATPIVANMKQPEVQLHKSQAIINSAFPQLLPQQGQFQFNPTVTNGHFIGFFYQINRASYMLRVFSLATGAHIHDDVFSSPEEILAATIDCVNRCYYVVVPLNNNRMCVRRFHFLGSDDPGMIDLFSFSSGLGITQRKLKKFAKAVVTPFSTVIGSQIIPALFIPKKIPDFEDLLNVAKSILQLPPDIINSSRDPIVSVIQSIVAIVHSNLAFIKLGSFDSTAIRGKILELIILLPTNLAISLFFPNLAFFFKNNVSYATSVLIGLYTRIKWQPLFQFALHCLENSPVLSYIPFSSTNQLTELIPQNVTMVSTTPPEIIRLLLAHQRVLVAQAFKKLKQEPFADVSFVTRNREGDPTALDNFGDYLQIIVTKFDSAISMISVPEELQNSLIFLLFDNFIRLISNLVEFHSIARVTTALISVLLSKIADFILSRVKNLDGYPSIANLILTLLFAYGKFASTLVKGGGLSEFEAKCMWLMRANINLIDDPQAIVNLDSAEIEEFSTPNLSNFLRGQITEPMQFLYKKHKAPFHKNLSDQLQILDRTVLAAVCKHTGLLDSLFVLHKSANLSAQIKKAADQMIKVRNLYRSLTQNDKKAQAEAIYLRSLMLLRMDSDFQSSDVKENLISEFLMSSYSPEYVKNIIKQQRTRVQVTLVGFALIDRTYSMQIHPLLNDIIAYTLSCIESFEGLAVIMRITQLKEGQVEQMKQFFTRILDMIETTHNDRFTLIAMRFFRDITNVKEIQSNFLSKVLNILSRNPTYYPMFALALSLIKVLDSVPEQFLLPAASPMEIILSSEIFKTFKGDDSMFEHYSKRFWSNEDPLAVRVLGRVMQQLLSSEKVSADNVITFFNQCLKTIGNAFVTFHRIEYASEIITLLRYVLNHNISSRPTLISLLTSITPNSSEIEIAGLFSILSHFLEPLHAYCNARFHKDRSTSTEVIAVPTQKPNEFLIYQKPFSLLEDSHIVSVTPPAFIYAVPLQQVNQKICSEMYNFILSFFTEAITNNKYSNITQCLYVQVIAHFMKEPEFMNLITKEQIAEFSVSPVPFGNITDTLKIATEFFNKQTVPQFRGFNQLLFQNSQRITLLSPQIRPAANFNLTFYTTCDRLRGYVGIVSDTIEGFSARYSLAELPSGTLFPACDKMRKLKPSQKYTLQVDMPSHTFTIGDNVYEFPLGKAFRILIAYSKDLPLEIECDMSNFDPSAFSPLQEHAALDFEYEGVLYEEPAWLKYIKAIPESPAALPKLDVDVTPVSYKERLRRNFVQPKGTNPYLIHPQFATQASREICIEAFRGLFRQITCQWMTIALVRVSAARPEMISDQKVIVKLFSILSVLLEQFFPNEYIQNRFPFSLDEPIWTERATTNLLYLSLDIESKNAMLALSKRPDVPIAVGKCITAMASDPNLHLAAYPNRAHIYFPPGEAKSPLGIRGSAIITVNSFTGQIPGFFTINKLPIDSPGTIARPSDIQLRIDPSAFALSVFNVSPMDNSWIFETPFEMLILLKSYISMSSNNAARLLAKSAIIDSLVASSPFILNYIPQFLELLQVTIPSTPLDAETPYKQKLLLMGSSIQQMTSNFQERMNIVYSHEQRVLVSTMAAELSCHFPEFFNSEIPKPSSTFCMIPSAIVDPGAITSDYMQHILMIRLFARKYTSLVGFPFWEILPLWYRISGFYKGIGDYISPEIRFVPGGILRFTNPSKMEVLIRIRPKQRLPADAIITRAKTDSFEDPDYIMYSDIGKEIRTKDETIFFSLIAVPIGWNAFNITFVLNQAAPTKHTNQKIKVDVSEIHSRFVADMEEFAIRWNDEDTDALLNVLPRNALQMPTFSTVDSIAKQSTLAMRFSSSVVSLRALLIHHFNFLKMSQQKEVPQAIWSSLSKFVSCEDASDEFVRAVAKSGPKDFPEIQIDRHAAHRLIIDGIGDVSVCIIHQLANVIRIAGPDAFRCPARAWRVKFVGEDAIDAGGPARELMTEVAASIFEATSQITYPVPNARHKVGQFLDFLVPFDATGKRLEDFRAIGTYLGIVVRTGLVQDLPFAPFVWKFLAGGELNMNDVIQVDNTLAEQFQHLREAEAAGDFQRCAVPWNIEQWDGTIAMLPGHSAEALVDEGEVEAYVNECINFRINSLRPTLVAMREAFVENIRVEAHPLLTGARLSHMAQGSSMITTQQLRAITVVQDFTGLDDPYIVRFFRAVDRFNADQRKMLLKFITTLTRLPNSSITQGFQLKIDRLQRDKPDESLPTASTCFNKLHLPSYSSEEICYQRLLVAIQYCQTMENR